MKHLPSLLRCVGISASAVSASEIELEQKLQPPACIKHQQLAEQAVDD